MELRGTTEKRRRLVLLVVGLLVGTLQWVRPATALTVDAGVCDDLQIDVTSTAVPRLPPAAKTWTLLGDGTCDTLVGENIPVDVSGSLSGVADQPTVGCGLAILDGTVTLDLTHADYDQPIDLNSAVVVAGAAVVLVGVEGTRVVGVGVFTQDTPHSMTCLGGTSIGSATWSGPLVLADPEV